MSIHYEGHGITLHHGDCLDVLQTLPDASVDSIVTDPPYGLGFMGKDWDDLPPGLPWAQECLRVLKPGGHLLAFGGTRTWHRLACAVEDAGFEVRDSIAWLYGSGFPKSLDVSKAIDKRPGVTRHAEFAAHLAARRAAAGLSRADVSERVVGTRTGACWNWEHHQFPEAKWWPALRDLLDLDETTWGPIIAEAERMKIGTRAGNRLAVAPGQGEDRSAIDLDVTTHATPAAEQWQGWGTALKPAFEPVVVARKPLTGTVAANVLTHGTGALNVDACRIEGDVPSVPNPILRGTSGHYGSSDGRNGQMSTAPSGRWPANVVLDEDMARVLDEQSGTRPGAVSNGSKTAEGLNGTSTFRIHERKQVPGYGDTGGASRFFYVAKAPKRERPSYEREGAADHRSGGNFAGGIRVCKVCGNRTKPGSWLPEDVRPWPACGHGDWEWGKPKEESGRVAHPTVKPLALMRWLVRLVTPPGGTVLEPFAGSGTTVEACLLEGFRCVAIEKGDEYLPLIRERIRRATELPEAEELTRTTDPARAIAEQVAGQLDIFGEATA